MAPTLRNITKFDLNLPKKEQEFSVLNDVQKNISYQTIQNAGFYFVFKVFQLDTEIGRNGGVRASTIAFQ